MQFMETSRAWQGRLHGEGENSLPLETEKLLEKNGVIFQSCINLQRSWRIWEKMGKNELLF